jgi:ABC-type transport system involved in multi-copper enzyme maturation permease subunit
MSAPTGTIRDQGYQPYTGPRTEPAQRWRLIYARMARLALRQGWLLTLLILSIFPALGAAVMLVLQLKVTQQLGAAGAPLAPAVPPYPLYVATRPYGTLLLAFLTALVSGAGAIADDLRSGATQFYFSRPVERWQYGLGKALVPVTMVGCVAIVPSLLVALVRLSLVESPAELLATLGQPLAAIALGLLETLALALPAVALSSVSKTRGYAQGSYAALFVLPWVAGSILCDVTRSPWPALLSLPAHLRSVGGALYGQAPEVTDRLFDPAVSALVLAALIVGSAWLTVRRVRALEGVLG